MPFRTDSPERDFDRWDMAREQRRAGLPICERCGEHIQDENLWDIDGTLYCPGCAKIEFERDTDNYTDED